MPGSGGPPGPPPPPGAPGAKTALAVKRPTKPKVTPEAQMKQLHWQRMLKDASKKTIWDDVQEAKIDPSLIVASFAAKVIAKKKPKTDDGGSAASKKPKVVTVLDMKRSSAIGIMLSKLPSPSVVRDGIQALNTTLVDREALDAIILNLPTPEEFTKVKDAAGPGVPLDKPEKFVLALAAVPRLGPRLRSWAFTLDYPSMREALATDLDNVEQACAALTGSASLRTVLGVILAYGNYLNGGTAKGQADGFDISFLPRLSDTKDASGSLTLLDHVVAHVAREHPGVAEGFISDLAAVRPAARIALDRLAGDGARLAALAKTSGSLAESVAKVEPSPGDSPDPFSRVVPPVIEAAAAEAADLVKRVARAQSTFVDTVAFFGVPAGRAKSTRSEDYFVVYKNFVQQYELALKRARGAQATAAGAKSGAPGSGSAAAAAGAGSSSSHQGKVSKADARKSMRAGAPGGDAMADIIKSIQKGQGGLRKAGGPAVPPNIGPHMLKKKS
jgi:hypothetical protein